MSLAMNFNFTRAWAVVLRQYYLIRGSWSRIVPMFVWVGIDIVLWGFITKYLSSIAVPGFTFVSTLLGAVLLWDLFIRITHSVGLGFLEDVWARNFLNIFASPITTGEYLLGLVITSIFTSFLGLAAMLLIAVGFFDLPVTAYGLSVFPSLLILYMFGIAVGICCIAMVLRLGPAAEWFLWPIPAIMSPFAGVFYPVATLPEWMQHVAQLLPLSYVFEGLRAVMDGGAASGTLLTRGLLLATAYILIACAIFRMTYKGAVKSGLIARYSAESVS